MAMELSVWSGYYASLSPEDAAVRFLKNGISTMELSTEHGQMLIDRSEDVVKTGAEFRAYLASVGMSVPQGHLLLSCRLVSNPDAVSVIKRWIDLYEAVGVKCMVLHIDNYNALAEAPLEEVHAKNAERLLEIAEHIKEKEIFICLENLVRVGADSADVLVSLIERLGSDRFGITLDTGHLNIVKTTTQREFILRAGKYLRALHIDDNEGAKDQHMMPFGRGQVDFCEVVSALREIGYEGPFNFEIPGESRCPIEIRDAKLAFVKASYDYLMSI